MFQHLIKVDHVHIDVVDDFGFGGCFCPEHRTASKERLNVHCMHGGSAVEYVLIDSACLHNS